MAALAQHVLLSSLKDLRQCDECLTVLVKRSILDPFQPDLQLDSRRKHPPLNYSDKRLEAIRLSPLALSIVNQNIQSLKSFKEWARSNINTEIDSGSRMKWVNSIKDCLFDTSFDAIAALKLMNVYLPLKPLDIEKTTSNLICKLVDLGEWTRALKELIDFRQHLANLGGVHLDHDLHLNLPYESTKHTCKGDQDRNDIDDNKSPIHGSYSDEIPFLYDEDLTTQTSDNQQQNLAPLDHSSPAPSASLVNLVTGDCSCCHPPSPSSWEETMIHKYSDLFTFPLDADMDERSTIMLVLAYQMNAIRSWCGINGGSMIKYLVVLMDRPGSFIDWCERLMSYDDLMAKKQLDLLQRHLMNTADKSLKANGDSLMTMAIQALALKAAACSSMVPPQSICAKFVSLGSNYEKSTTNVKYNHLQSFCADMMQALHPLSRDPPDLEAYFELSEYHAYVSRKAKIYPGAFSSYIAMIHLLEDIFNEVTTTPTCYYTALDALVKLSLCALQMDAYILGKSYVDLRTLLSDAISSIDAVIQIIEIDDICNNERTEWVLEKLRKSICEFWQYSSQFVQMVQQQDKTTSLNRPSIMQSPESQVSFELDWEQHMEGISSTLQGCHELLRLEMLLLKKLEQSGRESTSSLSLSHMLLTYVHIMIVLSRMHFDPGKDNTHHRSFEYLGTAERLCSDYEFTCGYRGISAVYFSFGLEMVKMNLLSKAVYPLRKACTILESNSGGSTTDADRLQLAKRYEALGACYQKDGYFKGTIKAYRMALKHIPAATIDLFTVDCNQLAISKLIERQPLIPTLIDRFIRISFSDNGRQTTYSTELMDLSALPPIQKCILHECELRVLLTLSPQHSLAAQEGWIVKYLLQHYLADQYPIRRSRTLLYKIRMIYANGLANGESIRSAIQCALDAQELLKAKSFGLDDSLQVCRRHYLALTYFWLGILRRELDENALDLYYSALHHWNNLLEKVIPLCSTESTLKEDLENVCVQIDDLDGLYNHLDILSDLLGLIGQPTLQVNSLRLLLKLNNGLRDLTADCYSDSVIITANIGSIYSELGYSGKASLEFSKVEVILAKYPCSNQAELHYLVQYSRYLYRMGDHDKSRAVFNAAKTLWDKDEQMDDPSLKSLDSMKQQAVKYLLISDCYLARSSISLHKESLDAAILETSSSYRVINNFLEYIKRPTRSNLDGGSIYSSQNINYSTVTDLLFNKHQWTTAMKLAACIERLAILHMTRGTFCDAQYYLIQGKQLGERVKSNAMVYRFLLLQSDSYLRTGQLDKSKSMLDSAITIHGKGPTHIWEDAALTSASGNLDAQRAFLHEALESYDIVDKLLLRMMDPAYIINLEALPESDEDYEQHPQLSQDASVVKDYLENTEYTCQILGANQVENAVRRLLVMAKIGLVSSGLKILEKFEHSGNTACNMNLLKAAKAHIRLMIIKDELMDRTNLTYMENSVLASTSVVSFSSNGGFTGTSHNIHMIHESLEQVINLILGTIKQCSRIETVALVEQLYLDAGSAMFLKNQISITDTNHASLTGYYLEMAKSISIRREMQSCLDTKLTISSPTTLSDIMWPKQVPHSTSADAPDDHNNIRPPLSALLSESTTAHLTNLRELYRQEYDLDGSKFSKTFVDILPLHWTVCSLTFNVNEQVLYVTQYRAGEPPLALRLSLNRAGKLRQSKYSGRGNVGISYQQAVSEFENIIGLHNETLHPNEVTLPVKDVEGWWIERSRLDARLKSLLEEMESSWIGGFKGLLTGRYHVYTNAFESFRKQLISILMTNINGSAIPNNKGSLDISKPILHMIIQLGINPTDNELGDVIYFLLACLERHDLCIDYSDITIDRMTQEIRQIVRSYHDQAAQAGINTMERLPNEHIILIPDKNTQFLPLESLPTLRSQSVSRLPCLSFLRDRILSSRQNSTCSEINQEDPVRSAWKDTTINRSKSYYVLNPNNDLGDTQAKFEHTFTRMHSWEGCTGRVPSEIECRSMLMEKDLYMYFGPGAGQSFIRGNTIRQLPKCAVVLLMGCNTDAPNSRGNDDQRGHYLDYLLAGSPAVVTNLWNMTEKSIHQVSQRLMDRWGLTHNATWTGFMHQRRPQTTKSLVDALVSSRGDCQFPHLVGASYVVYGVPVFVV